MSKQSTKSTAELEIPFVDADIVQRFRMSTQLGKRLEPKTCQGRRAKAQKTISGKKVFPARMRWRCDDCEKMVRGGDIFLSGHYKECPFIDPESLEYCLSWEARCAAGEEYTLSDESL